MALLKKLNLASANERKDNSEKAAPSSIFDGFEQQREALASLSDDERVEYEERAAIMEYDGGLSREEAERRAFEIVCGGNDNGHNKRHNH